jgi:multiple sugar transport system substrate-binding protein
VIGLLAALAAACGGAASDGSVTLDFWALGREGEVVQSLLPGFERANPGVRVAVQQIPFTAAHEKILTAFVGGSTPDLTQLGNTWIPELVALEAIEPLGERLSRSSVTPGDFFPGIWATNEIDGEPYGVPWYVDTRLLFYRADLWSDAGVPRPPRSWEEWRAAMRRVRALPGGERYGILLPIDEWAQPVVLALQAGAPLLRDADGTAISTTRASAGRSSSTSRCSPSASRRRSATRRSPTRTSSSRTATSPRGSRGPGT